MRELKKDLIQRLIKSTPNMLPEEVDDFVKACFADHEHIFYDKKQKKAYCTYCQKDIPTKHKAYADGVHKADGRCPICKTKITYKCIGRMRDISAKYWKPRIPAGTYYCINIIVMQKVADDYFVIRRFAIVKRTYAYARKTNIEWAENQRIYFDGIKRFNLTNPYGGWHESTKERFDQPDDWNMYIQPIGEFSYLKNLHELTEGSYLQYAKPAYKVISDYRGRIYAQSEDILDYFSRWRRPMEYLIKGGFYALASSMLYEGNILTGNEKSVAQVIGVPKEYFSLVKQAGMRFWQVRKLRTMIKSGVKIPDDKTFNLYVNLLTDLKECKQYASPLSTEGYLTYLKKQCRKMRETAARGEYKDYLQACHTLGYDLSRQDILFPSNLTEAHDRERVRLAEFNAQKEKHKYDGIEKRFSEENDIYAWHKDGLFIRMVRDHLELVREGSTLCHCVGSYASRVTSGDTTILVIRSCEDPNQPLVTLEYRKQQVIQFHGYKNDRENAISETVIGFITEWKKELQRREDRNKRKQKQAVISKVAV